MTRLSRYRLAALAAFVVLVATAGAIAGLLLARSGGDGPDARAAVIVDQLSLTVPNPDFVSEATALLEASGYRVDYVPGEQVTVDYYQELPKRGYDIVLVRAHAGRHQDASGQFTDETALFTGEAYSTSDHVDEQRNGLVTQVFYDETSTEAYFGIAPSFVRHSMQGGFSDAAVVLMGCDVLRGEQLAKSFLGRDASVVVGWDAPVSAEHTDAATLLMLRRHLQDGLSVQDAAQAAMDELGPDPYYGASLLAEPPLG